MEGPRARLVRSVGILAFTATAFLPVHSCAAGPADFAPPAVARATPSAPAPARPPRAPTVQRPARELVEGLAQHGGDGVFAAVWRVRTWYPYLLLPLWALALCVADAGGRGARRLASAAMAVSCVAIAAFEYRYITTDYTGVLPRAVLDAERMIAWAIVLVVLFARRRGRGVAEPAACVSAQALLAFLHGWTFPASDIRGWLAAGHAVAPIAQAVFANYHAGFWLALASLVLVAAPGYRRGQPAPGPAPAVPPAG